MLDATAVGNLEGGALYALHGGASDLLLRLGLSLPTASSSDRDGTFANILAAYARPTDFALAWPRTMWIRASASPVVWSGPAILRADAGLDLAGRRPRAVRRARRAVRHHRDRQRRRCRNLRAGHRLRRGAERAPARRGCRAEPRRRSPAQQRRPRPSLPVRGRRPPGPPALITGRGRARTGGRDRRGGSVGGRRAGRCARARSGYTVRRDRDAPRRAVRGRRHPSRGHRPASG